MRVHTPFVLTSSLARFSLPFLPFQHCRPAQYAAPAINVPTSTTPTNTTSLAEAMQKHSTELQMANESIDSFTRMLGEFVQTIKQIVPKIPKIIAMTETFSPSQGSSYSTQPAGSFAPPPVKDSTNIRK